MKKQNETNIQKGKLNCGKNASPFSSHTFSNTKAETQSNHEVCPSDNLINEIMEHFDGYSSQEKMHIKEVFRYYLSQKKTKSNPIQKTRDCRDNEITDKSSSDIFWDKAHIEFRDGYKKGVEDCRKDMMKQGKFTTSMNRKVCYETGYNQAIEDVKKVLNEWNGDWTLKYIRKEIIKELDKLKVK